MLKQSDSFDWLNRYLQLFIIVVSVAVAYQRVRGDLDAALIDVRRVITVMEQQQQVVRTVEMRQERMDQTMNDFRATYERDMGRYIRDTPKR